SKTVAEVSSRGVKRSNTEGQQILPTRHVQFPSPCQRCRRDVAERQLNQFFARGRTPDADGAVARRRGDTVAARLEGNRDDLLPVTVENSNGLPRQQGPPASGAG